MPIDSLLKVVYFTLESDHIIVPEGASQRHREKLTTESGVLQTYPN